MARDAGFEPATPGFGGHRGGLGGFGIDSDGLAAFGLPVDRGGSCGGVIAVLDGLDFGFWRRGQASVQVPACRTDAKVPEWMTVREVAAELRVSTATVYRMVQEGLPHVRVSQSVRVRRAELDRFGGGLGNKLVTSTTRRTREQPGT
ncbi:MAG: helix-turn-helix domain-containing protein [Myxococcales bacterium]|nr:helix-turn-helix domain-containing protein [Myxococcales bacterium]